MSRAIDVGPRQDDGDDATTLIATFGGVSAWLAIRTGGLEAALALHVVNNVTLFLITGHRGRSRKENGRLAPSMPGDRA